MKKERQHISGKKLAWRGALMAIACVFFYSQLVLIYVVSRSSAFIYQAMGKGQRAGILFANGLTLAYSVAIISLLITTISSLLGALNALILRKAFLTFNPGCSSARAFIISLAVSLLLIGSGYTLIHIFLIPGMASRYPEAFVFWIVIPSLICILANGIGGMALNKSCIAER